MKEWHGDDIETEDIVLEAENNEPPKGGDCEMKVAKLKAELDATKTEKQEYMDGWQRAKADYVNLLKRFEVETKAARVNGVIKAVDTLLPAFDALERSKEHGEIPDGFLAIAKQLESAFMSLGLEEIGKIGEQFNPSLHEALGQDVADSIATDDTITVVLEKGWKIGDVVIRPAKVRVGHFASAS
ncbi:MAG: nucleotide exchange factor GrpE [Minisyncoccia bacterium]